jgi:hypothetical protein
MEPILIPNVPRKAFNKDRHVSDLVHKQVEHFKHIEEKLPPQARAELPQHEIVTENDAARYIRAMTAYLLSRPRPKQVARKAVAMMPASPTRHSRSITLAAAAAPARKKSPPKRKSAPKKETRAAKKSPSIRAEAKKTSPNRKK